MKKTPLMLILAGFFFFALPSATSAAIAFDASSTGQTNSATSLTVSHTITGTDGLLCSGFITNNTSDLITGATYNSVAMSRIKTQTSATNGYWSYVYCLLAPTTGTHDIVISASSASLIWAGNISYTGVLQSGLPDATVSANGLGTSWSRSITTVADNAWHFLHTRGPSGTYTAPAVLRANASQSFSGDSNGPKTPAGSHTISGTFTGGVEDTTAIDVSFAPSAEAPPPAPSQACPLLGYDDDGNIVCMPVDTFFDTFLAILLWLIVMGSTAWLVRKFIV